MRHDYLEKPCEDITQDGRAVYHTGRQTPVTAPQTCHADNRGGHRHIFDTHRVASLVDGFRQVRQRPLLARLDGWPSWDAILAIDTIYGFLRRLAAIPSQRERTPAPTCHGTRERF